jgi:hypothetical protein
MSHSTAHATSRIATQVYVLHSSRVPLPPRQSRGQPGVLYQHARRTACSSKLPLAAAIPSRCSLVPLFDIFRPRRAARWVTLVPYTRHCIASTARRTVTFGDSRGLLPSHDHVGHRQSWSRSLPPIGHRQSAGIERAQIGFDKRFNTPKVGFLVRH